MNMQLFSFNLIMWPLIIGSDYGTRVEYVHTKISLISKDGDNFKMIILVISNESYRKFIFLSYYFPPSTEEEFILYLIYRIFVF